MRYPIPRTVPGTDSPSMPRKSMTPALALSLTTTSHATIIPRMPAIGVAMRAKIVVSIMASLPIPESTYWKFLSVKVLSTPRILTKDPRMTVA